MGRMGRKSMVLILFHPAILSVLLLARRWSDTNFIRTRDSRDALAPPGLRTTRPAKLLMH
jgi:hypothetical protein